MTPQRRFFLPQDLAEPGPLPAPMWPTVSLALLLPLMVLLPLGLLTALNAYLALLGAALVLGSHQAWPRPLLWALGPFVGLLLVAGLRGAGAPAYDYFRDAWYIGNPALCLVVGWVLAARTAEPARGLRAFVVGGSLVALLHLQWVVRHPELLSFTATQVRTAIGSGYFAPVLALTVLLAHAGRWQVDLRLAPGVAWPLLFLNAASLALAYSRTLTVVFAVGALAALGFFARQEIRRVAVLALLVLGLVLIVRSVIEPDSVQARTTFVGKFGRVFEELRVTQQLNPGEIEANWRGYETARALQHWGAGGPTRWLLGDGLGAHVDMGLFISLNRKARDTVRFIPTFHNGYAFLLVKAGALGFVLHSALLVGIYLLGRRRAATAPSPVQQRQGRLLQACAVTLAMASAIWFGTFHKSDLLPVLLLSGFLLQTLTRDPTDATH